MLRKFFTYLVPLVLLVLIVLEASDLLGVFRVKEVDVRGLDLLSRSDVLVRGGLDELVGRKLYAVKTGVIIEKLEAHPRIYAVEISKGWPSKLTVEIDEERETLKLILPEYRLIVSQGGIVLGEDREDTVRGLIPVKVENPELVRELEEGISPQRPLRVDYDNSATLLLQNLGRCAQDINQFFPGEKLSIKVDARREFWLLIDGFPKALLGRHESYAMIFKKLEKLRKMSEEGMVGIDHFDLRQKNQVRIRLARP